MARRDAFVGSATPEIKTHWEWQAHLMTFPLRTLNYASPPWLKCSRG